MKRFSRNVKDAETRYATWREANPEGFVINEKSDGWMLHTASCSHLNPLRAVDTTLMETPKSCSSDVSDLQQYSESQDQILRKCRQCDPAARSR